MPTPTPTPTPTTTPTTTPTPTPTPTPTSTPTSTPSPTPTSTPPPDTPLYIKPPTKTVTTEQQFTVDVWIEPLTTTSCFEFDLSFDPLLLTANNVACGTFLPSPPHMFNPGAINNTAGTITNVYGVHLGAGGVSSPGSLAKIRFTAKQAEGTSALHLYNVIVADPESQQLPLDITDGDVIIQTPTPTPTPTPAP